MNTNRYAEKSDNVVCGSATLPLTLRVLGP